MAVNEPGRWYTAARRLPLLVGKFPDGTPIPFGPFTLPQVLAVALTGWLLSRTVDLWARFGLIENLMLVVGLLVGVGWLARRAPSSGRNSATWLLDAGQLLLGHRQGSLNGRALRVPRPRRMVHRFVIRQVAVPTQRARVSVPAVASAVAGPQPARLKREDRPWLHDPLPPEYGSARRKWLDTVGNGATEPPGPLTGVQALLSAAVRTKTE